MKRSLFGILPLLCFTPDVAEGGSATLVAPEDGGTAQAGEATAPGSEPQPEVIYDLEEFMDGDFKGFKFVVPEFKSLDRAKSQLGGEALVLAVLNSAVAARIRTKVKNALPKNVKPQELPLKHAELLQKYPGGVLFTEDEAAKWRPEVRELTPNQLFKQAKEFFKKASEEPAKAMEHIAKAQQLLADMAKAMQS